MQIKLTKTKERKDLLSRWILTKNLSESNSKLINVFSLHRDSMTHGVNVKRKGNVNKVNLQHFHSYFTIYDLKIDNK